MDAFYNVKHVQISFKKKWTMIICITIFFVAARPRFENPQIQNEDISTFIGYKEKLKCKVYGYPRPWIIWYKNEQQISNKNKRWDMKGDANYCRVIRGSIDIGVVLLMSTSWTPMLEHAGSILSCASMRLGCQVRVDWRWFIKFPQH